MRCIAILLLFLGMMVGTAVPQPARAFASPMPPMAMTALSPADMAAMPDCGASAAKNGPQKPCKCGQAGCAAMMTSGAFAMLADGSVVPIGWTPRAPVGRAPMMAALHGRSTAPEPEPPSPLA